MIVCHRQVAQHKRAYGCSMDLKPVLVQGSRAALTGTRSASLRQQGAQPSLHRLSSTCVLRTRLCTVVGGLLHLRETALDSGEAPSSSSSRAQPQCRPASSWLRTRHCSSAARRHLHSSQPHAFSAKPAGGGGGGNTGGNNGQHQTTKGPTSTTELPPPSRPERPAEQSKPLGLKEYHYATFFTILLAGVGFLAVLLYLQAGIEIQQAVGKVFKRLLKTVALRQVSCG